MQNPRLVVLVTLVVVVASLSLAKAVLVPVALAMLLAFVLSPLVSRLERLRIGRLASVLCVTLLAFAFIGLVGWLVVSQSRDFAARLPEYRESLRNKVEVLREEVQRPLERFSAAVQDIGREPSGAPAVGPAIPVVPAEAVLSRDSALDWVPSGLGSLLSVLGTACIVVVLVILMLLQREDLRDRFIAIAGASSVIVTTEALGEGVTRLSRYLIALTVINGLYGVATGLGLYLIGLPNSLLWGFLAGVLRFIPYLGGWIAATFVVVFSLAVSDGFATPLMAIGLFALLDLLTNYLVEPLVYQRQVGVSSTALVISAVFWTWLWGGPGLVLATPLTVCFAVLGRHVPQMRLFTQLLGDQPVLSPAPRLYQRLLVMDSEEAWRLLAADLKAGKSLVDTYDSVVLPALCLAQQDRVDLRIDEATLARVTQSVRDLIDEAADRTAAMHVVEPQRAAAEASPPTPDPEPLRVLCVAAGHAADGVASTMICQVLRLAGMDPKEVPHEALLSEVLDAIESMHPDVVCISQLPPLSFSRLRYLCKRLAERFPELPIIVGTWTVNLDPDQARERIQWKGSCQFVGTLAEMRAQVQRLATPVPV